MPTIEFETEEEMDEHFERIEEVNMQVVYLKDAVEEAEKDLEYAKQELANYIEDNKEYII
jgi:glycerol-3-phosphate cytidylyltransferase-like family protein